MKIFIKYTILILSTFVAVIVSFYIYYKIIPIVILYRTLNDFEDACYSNDYKNIISMTSNQCVLYDVIQKDKAIMINHLFKKFEKGFHVTYKSVGRMNLKKINNSSSIICNIIKTAKIDNKKRDFYSIMIIKENDKWKILQYCFPDYIDY